MRATCVALLLASAQGAVIGIDLGSRFLKVGIIQPGTGIELVLNEATKRKSSSVAGFNAEEERIYGDESYNLLGKLPEKQFLFSKMLLGKQLDSPEVKLLKELGYPYEFLEDEESKGALYKYGSNATYKPEEAVAFVLSYAKQIAEAHAGSVIKDCVITVPPSWRHEARPPPARPPARPTRRPAPPPPPPRACTRAHSTRRSPPHQLSPSGVCALTLTPTLTRSARRCWRRRRSPGSTCSRSCTTARPSPSSTSGLGLGLGLG